PGKNVDVVEFFSYGCPVCAELEPVLQSWLKSKPADATFRRIPVMFHAHWDDLARIYYVLEAMGEERRLSPLVFVAIQRNKLALWEEKTFLDWIAAEGLDRKQAQELFASFAVVSSVNRAKREAQLYGVTAVPLVVVDGRYATNPGRLTD